MMAINQFENIGYRTSDCLPLSSQALAMALKPTIYKATISISDLNKDYYDKLSLTIAQHPSETLERMMVRILALCLNACENITFTAGLSTPDIPDIWVKTLDGQLALWIDVGEPSPERIKKATRTAKQVIVYSFNSKSDAWWSSEKKKFNQLNARVLQFNHESILALAKLVQRTMNFSLTITGDSAFIATELGECEISWIQLSN
jgi:uncharacterized protein YaeQ